jgi:hypothetical protein
MVEYQTYLRLWGPDFLPLSSCARRVYRQYKRGVGS